MANLEWYIARRYLASRRKGRFVSLITLISVGGVALGVMALITVIAVMTGLQRDLQAKILGSNPHVYVFEQGQGFRLSGWQDVLAEIQATPGVVSAEPFVLAQVGVLGQTATPGSLYGVAPDMGQVPLTDIERDIRSGKLALGPTVSGYPGVLVGARLAQRLGVLPGDTVTVGSFENIKTGPLGELMPELANFEVTGIFQTGMYEYDLSFMYAHMAPVQELLDFDSTTVSGIAVNIRDPWAAPDVASELFTSLGFPYYTDNWMTLNASLFSALKLEKLAMGVILFLIVLVAAFNIVSTLIMVVTDKTREIGILKSMGLTDSAVLRIFMLQGLAIGVIGTLIGAVGGFLLVWLLDRYQFIELPGDVYFIDRLPVALDPLDIGLILLASLVVALVATIYPARTASRLQPVDAIRHD